MLKRNPILKWILIVLGSLIVLIFSFGFWFISLLSSEVSKENLKNITHHDLPYLSENVNHSRGKILTVVTSCKVMGKSEKKTGFELTELSRAYYVFEANGYEVDIASPLGGKPTAIIDGDDMGAYDYAFLNDSTAQYKVNHSIPIKDVDSEDYQAVYFVGGKGAMFDFPDNKKIQSIISEYYESGKIVGAVCHGPAALVNVKLNDGSFLLANKTVSGFSNEEELFLIPDAETIFPFLLEDKLINQGARFDEGEMYLKNVIQDGNLLTGQNPWSVWALTESMVQQLGHAPVERNLTAEENTIEILSVFENEGYSVAKETIKEYYTQSEKPIDRVLIAMHGIIAAMQWKLGKAAKLVGLVAYAKKQSKD